MPDPVGLHCPGCGEHAVASIVGGQAFCGNEKCRVLMWDPARTLEELAGDIRLIRLFREEA